MRDRQSFSAYMRGFFHNWKGKMWFFLNMFFTIMYLMWRIFFTIPFEYGMVSVILIQQTGKMFVGLVDDRHGACYALLL